MMDESNHSSEVDESTKNTTRDQYLKHLNKISHRVSKPTTRRAPLDQRRHQPPPTAPLPPPPQSLQPPVYNINKNEFRDVVQKLTGSPAHDRSSSLSSTAPPPPDPHVHAPKPQASRLQRIRPPPLSAVPNRPPTLAAAPPPSNFPQLSPLSPLPPFPSVYGAAESPVSAYMRYFQCPATIPSSSSSSAAADSDSDSKHSYRPLISAASTAPSQFPMPSSPLPFGCLMSPRSPYPVLSPGRLLFSPTAGQLGFPQIPPQCPPLAGEM